MNEITLVIGTIIGTILIIIGSLKTISFLKKRNLVQCTGCGEIMNKKEFAEHKRTYHNMLGPKERMILFKSWLKDQYDQHLVKDLDKTIKQGCLIADITEPVARRIIENLKEMKPSTKELVCQCCGYVGTSSNVKPCKTCKNLFCEPCISDHPCFEGKSNPERVNPFDKKQKNGDVK